MKLFSINLSKKCYFYLVYPLTYRPSIAPHPFEMGSDGRRKNGHPQTGRRRREIFLLALLTPLWPPAPSWSGAVWRENLPWEWGISPSHDGDCPLPQFPPWHKTPLPHRRYFALCNIKTFCRFGQTKLRGEMNFLIRMKGLRYKNYLSRCFIVYFLFRLVFVLLVFRCYKLTTDFLLHVEGTTR